MTGRHDLLSCPRSSHLVAICPDAHPQRQAAGKMPPLPAIILVFLPLRGDYKRVGEIILNLTMRLRTLKVWMATLLLLGTSTRPAAGRLPSKLEKYARSAATPNALASEWHLHPQTKSHTQDPHLGGRGDTGGQQQSTTRPSGDGGAPCQRVRAFSGRTGTLELQRRHR